MSSMNRLTLTLIIGIAFLVIFISVVGAMKMSHQNAALPNASEASNNRSQGEATNAKFDQDSELDRLSMQEYWSGYQLGECLASEGCQVITGSIRTIGDPEAEANTPADKAVTYRKVSITIIDSLTGIRANRGDDLQVMSASRPALTKTAIGPWTPWEGANLHADAQLVIAIWGETAKRPQWNGQPEDIALVATDTKSIAAIQGLVKKNKQDEQSPEAFLNSALQPKAGYTPYLLGYTLAYLKSKVEISNVDNAALVLSMLLISEQVPGYVRSEICSRLLGNFYRMSDASRKAATESLIIAGSSNDIQTAEPAIDVLTRLGDDKLLEMRLLLTPERRSKLIRNYHSIVAKGDRTTESHLEFESQLGLKSR